MCSAFGCVHLRILRYRFLVLPLPFIDFIQDVSFMTNILWKYFTGEHHKEFVLSLGLLGDTGWPTGKQLRCLYAVSNHTERHYTRLTISKRDGAVRELLSPDPLLKKIQRNLLHNVLEEIPVSPYATAYRRGSGILGNASPHQGREQVLKLDIRDFFGSITYLMVYRCAFPRIYYPPSAATLLAHLCCYRDYLPQGAPTSPAISNLVMRPFDDHMGKWCGERGITYTRYCDDMTFSGDFDAEPVIRKVRSFLLSMGFELNEKKTQILCNGKRQSVTGIVVNEKPQVSRVYRDRLRQELYYCRKHGVASHLLRMNDRRYLPPEPEQVERYLRSLLGRVNYVLQVDPQNSYFMQARETVRGMIKAKEYDGMWGDNPTEDDKLSI